MTYVEVKSETNATEAPNQAVQEQKQEEENQMKKKKKKNKKRRWTLFIFSFRILYSIKFYFIWIPVILIINVKENQCLWPSTCLHK